MADSNLDKLRKARDNLAAVFKDEVCNEVFDNGLLDLLTDAIKNIEKAIYDLSKRGPTE